MVGKTNTVHIDMYRVTYSANTHTVYIYAYIHTYMHTHTFTAFHFRSTNANTHDGTKNRYKRSTSTQLFLTITFYLCNYELYKRKFNHLPSSCNKLEVSILKIRFLANISKIYLFATLTLRYIVP